jgi:integrase
MARERGSGSLRLRGGIYQARYWHNGVKIEESTKTDDLAKAQRFLRNRLKTAGTPDFLGPQAEAVTFADLKAGILHDYEVVKRNKSTKRVKEALAHLSDFFTGYKALAITGDRVREYVTMRIQEGAAASTRNRELSALGRMFRLNELVRRYQPEIRKADESGNVREGFLEPSDFEALLTARPDPCPTDPNPEPYLSPVLADAIRFAYQSLWRRENVLGLMWSHVTLETRDGVIIGGVIRLPHALTKNKKPLTLVLGRRLLEIIRRRVEARVPACPYVFHRDGRRIRDFRVPWRQAAEAVGQPGLYFHDLRRSGARNLRRAGKQEGSIMAMGGWKTRAMFLRYDITDESDLAQTADAYDDFLDAATADGRKVVNMAERKRRKA